MLAMTGVVLLPVVAFVSLRIKHTIAIKHVIAN